MRVRGLKLLLPVQSTEPSNVAPRAGAWIEIVAFIPLAVIPSSHPVRVRGLKLNDNQTLAVVVGSHPVRVRGLKSLLGVRMLCPLESHPVRVRGLKSQICYF